MLAWPAKRSCVKLAKACLPPAASRTVVRARVTTVTLAIQVAVRSATCAGARGLTLLSVRGFPSPLVYWQSSPLPTHRAARPKSCRARALDPVCGIMPVIKIRSLPSGGIMPDHACDRGAVRFDPGTSRSQAYQPCAVAFVPAGIDRHVVLGCLNCTSSVSWERPRMLGNCGERCHVAGTDVGEVAEVDGGDRGDRESLAHRDHRCVGPAQVPVAVASYEFGHAANV